MLVRGLADFDRVKKPADVVNGWYLSLPTVPLISNFQLKKVKARTEFSKIHEYGNKKIFFSGFAASSFQWDCISTSCTEEIML